MQEGLDRDDLYRMVEDELLATAQKFTVHLHAAEYKRYQKEVQSRNAQTINTISRPSAGSVSEETKRKIEAVQRASSQKKALDDVLGRKQEPQSDDESDGGADLPYAGTMLHELMDSPRKRAKTLSSIVPRTTISRSAAGYNKPATLSQQSSTELSQRKESRNTKMWSSDDMNPTSHDEDDLDIALPPLNLFKKPVSPIAKKDNVSSSSSPPPIAPEKVKKKGTLANIDRSTSTDFNRTPKVLPSDSPPKFGKDRPRISRFERARQQKEQEERERDKKKRSLDVIPTFL